MARPGEILLIIAMFPRIFNIKLKPNAINEPNKSLSKFLFFSKNRIESAIDKIIIETAERGSSNFFQNS